MQNIHITKSSVINVLLVLGAVWFLHLISDVLILLFISVILMSALNPYVDWFETRGFPRWLAILVLYIIVLSVLGILMYSIVPVLFAQMQEFINNLPSVVNQAIQALSLNEFVGEINLRQLTPELFRIFSTQLAGTPAQIIKLGAGVIGRLFNIFTLLVFTFYLLLAHKRLKQQLMYFLPKPRSKEVLEVTEKVEIKLGAWLRGQLVLMLVIGIMTWIGLSLLDVKFAVSLGVIAGLFEIIPIIGPIVSAVPAFMVAVSSSIWKGLAVVVLYVLIQQLESAVFVPRIMKKATGLDPLAVLLALLVGGRIGGTTGTILAIPVVAVLMILWREYRGEDR